MDGGVGMDSRDLEEMAALHHAAATLNHNLVSVLIKQNAHVHVRDKAGRYALQWYTYGSDKDRPPSEVEDVVHLLAPDMDKEVLDAKFIDHD